MADPSFNGANIFGPAPDSARAEPPNARQRNGYPGVRGIESIDLGHRESYTDFAGVWAGTDEQDLLAFLNQMLALKRSGVVGTLVDTKGIASDDAILESWQLTGPTRFSPSHGVAVPYQMRFLHLGTVPTSGGGSGTGSGTGTGTGTGSGTGSGTGTGTSTGGTSPGDDTSPTTTPTGY